MRGRYLYKNRTFDNGGNRSGSVGELEKYYAE